MRLKPSARSAQFLHRGFKGNVSSKPTPLRELTKPFGDFVVQHYVNVKLFGTKAFDDRGAIYDRCDTLNNATDNEKRFNTSVKHPVQCFNRYRTIAKNKKSNATEITTLQRSAVR